MPKKKPSGIKTEIKKNMSLDSFICTFAVCISAVILGSQAAALRIVFCGTVGAILDLISNKFILKNKETDFLSVVSQSVMIALVLPADVPLFVCFTALAVMVFVAKLPFGGDDYAPFVPSAVGICFVYTLFSAQCSSFGGTTVAEMLKTGDAIGLNVFSVTSLLCGNYPGGIGACALLPLLGVAVYLLIRQRHKFICAAGFILMSAVFALLFPRISGSPAVSAVMELSAGSLVFTALFILPESIYLSRKSSKAFVFGAAAGLICMLLRYVSPFADSAPFSVLLTCALWPLFAVNKPKMKKHIVYKKAGKANEK